MKKEIFIFNNSLSKEIYNWSRHYPEPHLMCFANKRSLNETLIQHLSTLGWKAIPPINIDECLQERFLEEYLEIVAQFAEWNAQSILWWATHFSSKNRLNSPILPLLQEWVECIHAIESCPNEASLALIDVSWKIIVLLKSLAPNHGWKVTVYSSPLSHFRYRLRGKFYFWRSFLAEVIGSLIAIWIARKTFKLQTYSNPSNTGHYLIKSFTFIRNFQEKGEYIDPFFGHLPKYMYQFFGLSPSPVLTVALGFQEREQCYTLMKELQFPVHPLEIYLHYSDVILRTCQWLYQFFSNSFEVKEKIEFRGYEVTAFFREFVLCGGLNISFFQFLHFDIAKRLGQKYQIKTCLMTYEGRPWERFFMAGLRASRPDVHIIGCQHTVIPQSATDMFLHPKEKNLIPLPDKIITTGLITKKILDKYSAYPQEKVYAGCALRFESLQKLSLIPRKSLHENQLNEFNLLVAFGGTEEEVPLLNYALEQAEEIPDTVFRMRPHPVFPFDQLLQLSLWRDKALPNNIEESNSPSVIEDLNICDAVLYWGTTVSIEALKVGKPIIQFDRGDFLNYDPLFEFIDFKWQVKQGYSLQVTIQKILNLSNVQYGEGQRLGRMYAEQYFYPVTKDNLAAFLPDVSN